MFGFLKKKKTKGFSLGSPVKGATISLKEVNDPTFREGMLGEGVAIKPTEGKIYAPADGSIGMVCDTLHAISLTTMEGAEVLIHVGLDIVHFVFWIGLGHAGTLISAVLLLTRQSWRSPIARGAEQMPPRRPPRSWWARCP